MRSWVLLLLLAALSAARLRLGRAESDPLPPSLVDLVRNSPISSVDDLKLLLQQEASVIEEDEDEHDVLASNTLGRYSRSLVEAQPAQQAACKVRTEVMEVTRSMLDRSNANFLLWPSCVEVQRCSGCCNTWQLTCVPTLTHSRRLQVTRIQYVNGKAHYDKAVISVEDHVSCRCQPASSSRVAPVTQSSPPPSPRLPPARPVLPAPGSKADLHRHDDLKHNQQRHPPEEPAARPWQQGSYTQLVHWTPPRPHVQPGVLGHGSGYDGSREDKRRQQQFELRTQFRLGAAQSDGASPPGSPTQTPALERSPSLTTRQKDSASSQKTTEASEREQSGGSAAGEPAARGGQRDGGLVGEEARRQKLLEMVQREPDHHSQPRPTTFKTAPSTVTPLSSSARKAPFHPASPRRRRKHRKRISKAAIRAMIM